MSNWWYRFVYWIRTGKSLMPVPFKLDTYIRYKNFYIIVLKSEDGKMYGVASTTELPDDYPIIKMYVARKYNE